MTDKQVRDIVRGMLRSEMLNIPTKAEAKNIAKEEAEKAVKKAVKDALTTKDAKQMIVKTFHNYQRWMWEKKGMWMNQI